MRLLLDTHIFIWWDSEKGKLSPRVLGLCQDRRHTLVLSVASIWEMQIKLQLGKLRLERPLEEIVEHQQQINAVEVLPVSASHVFRLQDLPHHHADPFDRLLIAQARAEKVAILSVDPVFAQYPVEVLA